MDKKRSYIPGCVYIIKNKNTFDRLIATGNFYCIDYKYDPKPWWKIWKRRTISNYTLMCMKPLK